LQVYSRTPVPGLGSSSGSEPDERQWVKLSCLWHRTGSVTRYWLRYIGVLSGRWISACSLPVRAGYSKTLWSHCASSTLVPGWTGMRCPLISDRQRMPQFIQHPAHASKLRGRHRKGDLLSSQLRFHNELAFRFGSSSKTRSRMMRAVKLANGITLRRPWSSLSQRIISVPRSS
jgi:hypothetical protein